MKFSSQTFQKAYSSLNKNQRLAVDTIEGPVLVLAGPGTGKTQVLTTRIANILEKTDTEPSSILALTFTDSATKEMRSRLTKMLGKDGFKVRISTFHALCNDIIEENSEIFSQPKGQSAITDLEKFEFISKILTEAQYLLLKPLNAPDLYLRDIIPQISNLKREGITPKKYAELVTTLHEQFEIEKDDLSKTALADRLKLLQKNIDLLKIYDKYQEEIKEQGKYDYEDMINWVNEAFEKGQELLLAYQEKFQYILVDEYQDTNSAQNNFIFLLSSFWGQNANLFVVGDENQSIYRFQGASKENVIQYKKTFPNATIITLTDNYRSTKNLLESTASLIGESPLTKNISLKNKKIKVAKFTTSLFEDEFIISTIKRKIKKGKNPSDFAIITKENKEIDSLVNLFKRENIPYRLEGKVNILNTPLIGQFIKLLKVIATLSQKTDDLELFTVLNFPIFNLKPLSILKIARYASTKKETLTDTLLDAHPEVDKEVISLFSSIISWNSKATHLSLPEIFQVIFQESGFLNHILGQPQPLIELNRFGSLFEEVKKQSESFQGLDLFGFVANLQVMEQNNLTIEEQPLAQDQNAVTLTTAHKAKGLEWNTIFIYRFADSHWSNKTRREMIKLPPGILNFEKENQEAKEEEEKRLFYVALTRAKQQIYLTGAENYSHSKKMVFPAMFLFDLPEAKRVKLNTKNFEDKKEIILSKSLKPQTIKDSIAKDEEEYLKEIIENFRISPTALNTYLKCPYKFKLDNLYRIPRAKAPAMCYGTAIHYALENLYQNLNQQKKISKEELIGDFKNALQREILSEHEIKDYLQKGKNTLTQYFDFYQDKFAPCLFTEKKFGSSTSSQVTLGDIPLTGKVDRIDEVNKKDKEVTLIDYKTGKIRSRNDIEGNTQNSDGDYKRQLIFYRLLSILDTAFQCKANTATIEFVEPDKDGKFISQKFDITDKEVEELKETIKDTSKRLKAFRFHRTKDTTTCQRCDFKTHCYPEGIPHIDENPERFSK